jgi:hypothetical protein
MLEKDFAPHPEALELKQLGFDEPCFKFYIETGELIPASYSKEGTVYPANSDLLPEWTASPTYSQAFRWFREKHGMVFNLVGSVYYYPSVAFVFVDGSSEIELGEYDNYEEAELACLRKMIEIVKASRG